MWIKIFKGLLKWIYCGIIIILSLFVLYIWIISIMNLRMVLKKFWFNCCRKKRRIFEVFLNMFVVWFILEILIGIKLVELLLGSKMLFLFDVIF